MWKKKILPEENQEEKNEILDKTCRNNSSWRNHSGLKRKANPENLVKGTILNGENSSRRKLLEQGRIANFTGKA